MIWQVAAFSGIEVLSYCVMSNHFHLLISVPNKQHVELSDKELVRRYKTLYPKPHPLLKHTHKNLKEILAQKDQKAEEVREWLLSRMHNLPVFMKCLKQRLAFGIITDMADLALFGLNVLKAYLWKMSLFLYRWFLLILT
jgi:hypothetical protein